MFQSLHRRVSRARGKFETSWETLASRLVVFAVVLEIVKLLLEIRIPEAVGGTFHPFLLVAFFFSVLLVFLFVVNKALLLQGVIEFLERSGSRG